MARGSSGGGESKQGFIITIIFFVLATIILGVTTYLDLNQNGNIGDGRHCGGCPPNHGGGAGMLGTNRLRSSQIMVAAANTITSTPR